MTRKIKLSLLLTSIVLIIVAVSTAGVSFAIWTSQEGGIGGNENTSVSPSVIAENEYVWAKYFQFDTELKENSDGSVQNLAILKTFYADGVGINLADVYIPSQFKVENMSGEGYTVYSTYRITNQVFMDATMKKLPVVIYIPESVMEIDMFAFSNLPNLQKVVFLGGNEKETCRIADYAFAGCSNLVSVECIGGRNLQYSDSAFVGCNSSLTKPSSQS